MTAADEQYGNKGYGQIGAYGGNNPYDQRDNSPAGGDRYNNYAQGRYDDRMYCYKLRVYTFSNTV